MTAKDKFILLAIGGNVTTNLVIVWSLRYFNNGTISEATNFFSEEVSIVIKHDA